MHQQRTIGVFGVLLIGSLAFAQTNLSLLLQRFDQAMETQRFRVAKALIDSLVTVHPRTYSVLWRAARAWIVYGNQLQDEKQQESAYEQAKHYAESAIAVNPKGMEGYLYRAAANGKIALFRGVFSVGSIVRSVRDDVRTALGLPTEHPFHRALAHYILGRTHLKLSEKPKLFRYPLGLAWGNLDTALVHLRQAVSLDSMYIMFRLDYARALLENDQSREAAHHLRAIQTLPIRTAGDQERKNEAQRLLRELE